MQRGGMIAESSEAGGGRTLEGGFEGKFRGDISGTRHGMRVCISLNGGHDSLNERMKREGSVRCHTLND